jgi:Transglycosylase SLT domain
MAQLILATAPLYGVQPEMALAIAFKESSLNPMAVGKLGEIGLFQMRPQMYPQIANALTPRDQVHAALKLMAEKRRICGDALLPTCWNYGTVGMKRLTFPYHTVYAIEIRRIMHETNSPTGKSPF